MTTRTVLKADFTAGRIAVATASHNGAAVTLDTAAGAALVMVALDVAGLRAASSSSGYTALALELLAQIEGVLRAAPPS